MNFSGWEIILVVAVLFLLFGASRLPQLAKSIGQSKRAFKEGLEEAEREAKLEDEEKQKLSAAEVPKITSLTDEELAAEMLKREQVKQV